MSFIVESDWPMQIRSSVLDVIKGSNAALEDAILTAISDMESYLRSKYDVATIFAPVYEWNNEDTFALGARIQWTAPAHSISTTYAEHNLVSVDGRIYKAKNTVTTGRFNSAQWDDLAANNSFYRVIKTGGSTASILPTDTDEFEPGDTRHKMVVTLTKDIALYHIHSNISPQNIPALRKERYDYAMKWLTKVSNDQLTADLPLIDEDITLGAHRFGGGEQYSTRW